VSNEEALFDKFTREHPDATPYEAWAAARDYFTASTAEWCAETAQLMECWLASEGTGTSAADAVEVVRRNIVDRFNPTDESTD